MAAEVPSGVWSTVTDQAPGNAPDAMPTKRPWVDAAAYSSPLTESEDAAAWDVDAAIAAAGLMTRAAAATIGTVHPRHRMTCPPFKPAGEPNSEGSSVCKPSVWPDRSSSRAGGALHRQSTTGGVVTHRQIDPRDHPLAP